MFSLQLTIAEKMAIKKSICPFSLMCGAQFIQLIRIWEGPRQLLLKKGSEKPTSVNRNALSISLVLYQ